MSEPKVIAAARAMLRGYYNCVPLPTLAEQLADALADWRPVGETPIDGALLAETQRCLCEAMAENERLRAAHDGLLAEVQGPRSGLYLTVVYRDVQPGPEVTDLARHPKVSALSWSHAIDDRDEARAALEEVGFAEVDAVRARRKGFAAGKVFGLQSARTMAEAYCLASKPSQESIRHILSVVDEIGAAIDVAKSALDEMNGGAA